MDGSVWKRIWATLRWVVLAGALGSCAWLWQESIGGFLEGAGIEVRKQAAKVGRWAFQPPPSPPTNPIETGAVKPAKPPAPKPSQRDIVQRAKCEQQKTDSHKQWRDAEDAWERCLREVARNPFKIFPPYCQTEGAIAQGSRAGWLSISDAKC
jgi:hypothetical protein